MSPNLSTVPDPMLLSFPFAGIVLALLLGYLLGSVSFAVVVSKLMGLSDPRTYGSGNPGATNVLRSGNKAAAILTLIGDGAKGWLAVWLAQVFAPQYGLDDAVIALVPSRCFWDICGRCFSASSAVKAWR